jgi:hypothetical protein
MSQTFVVVKIYLQTGGFTLLSRYLRSQLFVWVGVLMVYTRSSAQHQYSCIFGRTYDRLRDNALD